jgi:hypothetical protein
MTKLVVDATGQRLELDEHSTEPVLKPATIVAAVGAVLALAVSFGFDLTQAQLGSILTLTTVVAPLAAGWLARRKAWSGRSVSSVLDAAARDRR